MGHLRDKLLHLCEGLAHWFNETGFSACLLVAILDHELVKHVAVFMYGKGGIILHKEALFHLGVLFAFF